MTVTIYLIVYDPITLSAIIDWSSFATSPRQYKMNIFGIRLVLKSLTSYHCEAVVRTNLLPKGDMHFSDPTKRKSLHRSTWNYARLITSMRQSNVPKMVGIGPLGASPHIREIYAILVTIVCLALPFCFSKRPTGHNSQYRDSNF